MIVPFEVTDFEKRVVELQCEIRPNHTKLSLISDRLSDRQTRYSNNRSHTMIQNPGTTPSLAVASSSSAQRRGRSRRLKIAS